MSGNLGRRVQQLDSACSNSDDEVEALIRGEVISVTVDPQQQHHKGPRNSFVPINKGMEPGGQRRLYLVGLIVDVLQKESTRADGEALSARDLFLAIRDIDGVNTDKEEITGILRFLTNPLLRVLTEQSGGYMLTERRDTSGLRLNALASAVAG